MAMPPIVVVLDLFAHKGSEADRVRSEQSMLLVMEAMCAINQLHLKQKRYPKLYESGVVYRREDGTENWLDIPHVIKAGWGDSSPAYRRLFSSQFFPGGTPEQMAWFDDLMRMTTTAEVATAAQDRAVSFRRCL